MNAGLTTEVLTWAVWFFVGSALVSMVRVIIGPSLADRMTAFNVVSAQVLVVIVLIAVRDGRSSYLDVALVYDIFGFIGILTMARYFSRRLL